MRIFLIRNHEQGSIEVRALVFALGFILIVALFSWPFYHSLKMNSLRSEAKVMLGYIASLQAAHHLETQSYVGWSEPYGATIFGKENCSRPAGAVELGFVIKGCDRDPKDGGVLFVYRVLDTQPESPVGFRAEAQSGSDITGEDLICGSDKNEDVWEITLNSAPQQVKECALKISTP